MAIMTMIMMMEMIVIVSISVFECFKCVLFILFFFTFSFRTEDGFLPVSQYSNSSSVSFQKGVRKDLLGFLRFEYF